MEAGHGAPSIGQILEILINSRNPSSCNRPFLHLLRAGLVVSTVGAVQSAHSHLRALQMDAYAYGTGILFEHLDSSGAVDESPHSSSDCGRCLYRPERPSFCFAGWWEQRMPDCLSWGGVLGSDSAQGHWT